MSDRDPKSADALSHVGFCHSQHRSELASVASLGNSHGDCAVEGSERRIEAAQCIASCKASLVIEVPRQPRLFVGSRFNVDPDEPTAIALAASRGGSGP